MNKSLLFTAAVIVTITATIIISRPFRVTKIPNGGKFQCANCHVDPNGGGTRNKFGQAVEARVTPNGQEDFWGPSLATLDSDNDGRTNGQELGDPAGAWRPGQTDPGNFSLVSNPGDELSTQLGELAAIPNSYKLLNNYPNPFNPSTRIIFEIPQSEYVSLKIYNINGDLVKTLSNENLSAGHFEKEWDGKNESGNNVTSGIYIYRLIAGKFDRSAKMILMK
jgi:hypothetical protein